MPPVSSRTTSRSVPSIRSRLSGLASSRAVAGRTGRRLANRPSPLRRPSSPCSGRGSSGLVVSHLGPPTAASSTASELRHAASVSGVRAVPCWSIETPPIGWSSISKPPRRSSSARALSVISGPIPSPGRATIFAGVWVIRGLTPSSRLSGVDVQAYVVEDQRRAGTFAHRVDEPVAQLLGQALQVVAEADDAQELARLGRGYVLVLEPAFHVGEARPGEALGRLRRRGEIPG